ncbi:hypothetical protein HOLleu_41192 [Holothuria leucospilota]|uniref:Uncharacterized protein n=1 Tax=Holothuria leucospilota TaxID=206669 RepID=A0A9Q0YB85_HOLLE|nr:hypothetical protein HOLleu_41192 [Holothuria leucospilota]
MKTGNSTKDDLSVEELKETEIKTVKWVQRESFPSAMISPSKCKVTAFRKLSLVLVRRVLRVREWLSRSQLHYDLEVSCNSTFRYLCEQGPYRTSPLLSGSYGGWYDLDIRAVPLLGHARRRDSEEGHRDVSSLQKGNVLLGQQMAELPVPRVTADKPPFSSVGIDLFGPFLIKRGRS